MPTRSPSIPLAQAFSRYSSPLPSSRAVDVRHVERRHRPREERGPAADELDLLAGVEQHLDDAGRPAASRRRRGRRRGRRPAATRAARPSRSARCPARRRAARRRAGSRSRSRCGSGDGAGRDDDAVRRELRARASAVASVPSRTSTPTWRSCTSRSRVIHPNSSRPGVRRIRLTWPPSSRSPLEERHRVAAPRERHRRLHPGRPAAGDDPASRGSAGRDERAQPSLATGRRIDRAADRQPLEDAADAALVAADAVDDLVLAALLHLVRELRVGDLRARHRDHVGLARGEDLLGERRVLDPADGEHGQPPTAAFTCAVRSTR